MVGLPHTVGGPRCCLLAGMLIMAALFFSQGTATVAEGTPRPAQRQRQMIVVPNVDTTHGRRLVILEHCGVAYRPTPAHAQAKPEPNTDRRPCRTFETPENRLSIILRRLPAA